MTISDIAKMAGVSSAAVSRYFNNGYLSEDKRTAIRKVIEETGYHPSSSAQTLRTKKTKTIGLIIPMIDHSSAGRVLAGLQPILDQNGYRLLFVCSYGDVRRELEYLETFDNSEVDGIILVGTSFSANYRKSLLKVKVPLVILGQEVPGFSSVYFDDYHAFYSLTSRFIEKGRNKIGYIGITEKDHAIGENRRKGFLAALKDHGMSGCRDHYVIAEHSIQTAYRKMGELYAMNPDLDAVICATDQLAMGARAWLREYHPELIGRVAIAGQGDEEALGICCPPISTIRYQYERAGEAAIRRLLEVIERDDPDHKDVKEVMLSFELVDRMG